MTCLRTQNSIIAISVVMLVMQVNVVYAYESSDRQPSNVNTPKLSQNSVERPTLNYDPARPSNLSFIAGDRVTSTDYLNVRTWGSTQAVISGIAKVGSLGTVVGIDGVWVKVKWDNELFGMSHSAYLKSVPTVASPPNSPTSPQPTNPTPPQTVSLTNDELDISISGDFILQNKDCTLTGLKASKKCLLNVFFKPTTVGLSSGMLSIRDTTTNSTQRISLRGVGVVAQTSPPPLQVVDQAPIPVAMLRAGDRIQASDNVNVRTWGSVDAVIAGTEKVGSLGRIINIDGQWIKIQWDDGLLGMSNSYFIVLAPTYKTIPVPTMPPIPVQDTQQKTDPIQSTTSLQQSASTTPSYVYASCGNSGAWSANSYSFSHTTSGTNRILVVSVYGFYKTVASVKYGGTNLRKLTGGGYGGLDANIEMWYLVNPPLGTNEVSIVTTGSSGNSSASATTYTNVNQSNPFGTPAIMGSASGRLSVTVNSSINDLIIDAIATHQYSSRAHVSQTERYSCPLGNGVTNGGDLRGSTKSGGASVSMEWINDGRHTSLIAVPLRVAISQTTADASRANLIASVDVETRPGLFVRIWSWLTNTLRNAIALVTGSSRTAAVINVSASTIDFGNVAVNTESNPKQIIVSYEEDVLSVPQPQQPQQPQQPPSQPPSTTSAVYHNPILPSPLMSDPSMLLYNGVYYLYGSTPGNRVQLSSTMYGPWTTGPSIVSPTEGAWAPHVIGPKNGVFYDYYVDKTGNSVAIGTTPTAFTKVKTLIPGGGDPWLFEDDDGQLYFYYAIWVNIGGKGQAVIRVRRMTDFVTLANEPDTQVLIQTPSATWERVTVEGPSVFKRNGTYYMIYAAGALPSTYATGYATASNPMGPWTKYSGNPIMSTGGNIHGPGHGSVITDKTGELWFVYHQQKQPVLVTALWDRVATLDKLVFDANGVMSIKATHGIDVPAPSN